MSPFHGKKNFSVFSIFRIQINELNCWWLPNTHSRNVQYYLQCILKWNTAISQNSVLFVFWMMWSNVEWCVYRSSHHHFARYSFIHSLLVKWLPEIRWTLRCSCSMAGPRTTKDDEGRRRTQHDSDNEMLLFWSNGPRNILVSFRFG